jgi:hypothetical protein
MAEASGENHEDGAGDQPLEIPQLRETAWEELGEGDQNYLRSLARCALEECVFAFGIEAVRSAGGDGGFILEGMNGLAKEAMRLLKITNSNAIYKILGVALKEVIERELDSLV